MFFEGMNFLESHGYIHYEVSNFSRPSFECKHNLGYWQGVDYLGVGPSAVSTLSGIRYTNTCDLIEWEKGIKGKGFRHRKEGLAIETQRKEKLMLSLRTAKGLDLISWNKETGQLVQKTCPELINALVKQGYMTIDDKKLSLTKKGFYVSNEIISRFFEIDALFYDVSK